MEGPGRVVAFMVVITLITNRFLNDVGKEWTCQSLGAASFGLPFFSAFFLQVLDFDLQAFGNWTSRR